MGEVITGLGWGGILPRSPQTLGGLEEELPFPLQTWATP